MRTPRCGRVINASIASDHSIEHEPACIAGFVRSDFFATMVLADAHLAAGELEQACATALRALTDGELIRSARCVRYLGEFQRHLERAMDELPEKLRLVLILATIEGHNLREVGRLLGLPEGTVKSRLHLARKQLAEKLRWIAVDIRKP